MTSHARIARGALGAALALALVASPALAETTLWLVRPLYPGQEALVERTEQALDKLIPGDARRDAVIGVKELGRALGHRTIETVPCFSADRCKDPIDPFVASLGFDRVVLLYGGQDEDGFKFRAVSYEPKTGKVARAAGNATGLEKALLGAVSKVVPAASTLEVTSTPPGATVYVDGEKVGKTPLPATPVLAGEHVVRLDLEHYQVVEETLLVPIRGRASLDKGLVKVAARIRITVQPAGASISIDGKEAGKDKVERGIEPGRHVIRLAAKDYKEYEQTIDVKPDEQFTLDRSLEPIKPAGTGPTTIIIVDKNKPPPTGGDKQVAPPPPPPPPPPPSWTEKVLERRSYFQLSFTSARLEADRLVGRRWGTAGTGRTERILSSGRSLLGGTLEYGTFGKYFGVAVAGVTYLTNADDWTMSVGFEPGKAPEVINGTPAPTSIDHVKVHLVTIRALQPQLRFALWRFQFSLQAGLEFRTGQILAPGPFSDGFMPLDLMLSGRFNARAYLFDGVYLAGAVDYVWYLIGETTDAQVRSAGTWGFNVGVGYGF